MDSDILNAFEYVSYCLAKRMAPTTTVIDAGKDLSGNHTPTFVKESFYIIQLYTATARLHVHV